MLSLRLSVISVCLAAVNVLSASIRKLSVTKASLPKSFEWSSSDPSIVEVGGAYHVFASTAKEAGYNLLWYLVYQNGNAAYSTNSDISNPAGWSAPKNFFDSMPSFISENICNGNWVDMWTICDSSDCYLFSSDDNGHLYRSPTSLGNFPNAMGNIVIALQDTNAYALFEASNVHNTGDGDDGARYFRSWISTSLSGTWTSLADTEASPFARSNNVKFSAEAWTKSISHGEIVRTNVDQTMTIAPCNLRYLYQGVDPNASGDYNAMPWKLGLLTQANSALLSAGCAVDTPSKSRLQFSVGIQPAPTPLLAVVQGLDNEATLVQTFPH
ncbi:glycosyl hydrolase family 62-domain-containing protein [Aspergillus novoparasiticus]|uniref:Alpha-L-arabinofuranosidase n=1 Tax=Aspergillus novoparasiticus TaxID=986946 RepID=A0A5N6EFP3_9EURO|nr:glycosyl hydrolase family 62-domain-containing protein [Aspergillus novoparasiticus]